MSLWRTEPCPACCGGGTRKVLDGPAVRSKRRALGLTLQDLGDTVGRSQAYLSHIESGRKPGHGITARRIVKALEGDGE